MQLAVRVAPRECAALVAVWRVRCDCPSDADLEAPTLQGKRVRSARLYLLRFAACRAECFSNRRALIRIACIRIKSRRFHCALPVSSRRRLLREAQSRWFCGRHPRRQARLQRKGASTRGMTQCLRIYHSIKQACSNACCRRGSRCHNKNPPVGGFLHYWCAVAALVTPMHQGHALPTTHCGRSNTSTSASRASASTISGSPVTCKASPAASTWPLTVRLPRATCT